MQLPPALVPYKHKLFGLTIDPARLSQIRNERRPHSHYASLENCRKEVAARRPARQSVGLPPWPWYASVLAGEVGFTFLHWIVPAVGAGDPFLGAGAAALSSLDWLFATLCAAHGAGLFAWRRGRLRRLHGSTCIYPS